LYRGVAPRELKESRKDDSNQAFCYESGTASVVPQRRQERNFVQILRSQGLKP
jgi:hypothetical protein